MKRQDCGNVGIVEKYTNAVIISKSETGENNLQAGLNISILPILNHQKLENAVGQIPAFLKNKINLM